MNDVKNKGKTTCEDLDGIAIRNELSRTVKNYSKVIDMIEAILQFEEPMPKPKEPPMWRKLLKNFFN